jgi:hypothetical protein
MTPTLTGVGPGLPISGFQALKKPAAERASMLVDITRVMFISAGM